jgi:hypothetical protein
VWLDAYIGYRENNRQLKRYFNIITTINMAASRSSKNDIDIDNLIKIPRPYIFDEHQLDNNRKILWTFSNVDDCVRFINTSSDYGSTLFVIASGVLGRKLVPQIFNHKRVYAIYIFTCNIFINIDWVSSYMDKVLMFDHELDLLSRLTKDIAEYYVRKALETIENLQHSLHYLQWAKKLLYKANIVDERSSPTMKLKQIEAFIEQVEKYSSNDQKWEDSIKHGVECDEG